MHPLAGDLDSLKDSEIESKITELTNRYFMSRNPDMKFQISLLLDSYNEEINKRRSAQLQRMMEQRDKSLDKLIKIS